MKLQEIISEGNPNEIKNSLKKLPRNFFNRDTKITRIKQNKSKIQIHLKPRSDNYTLILPEEAKEIILLTHQRYTCLSFQCWDKHYEIYLHPLFPSEKNKPQTL